MLHWVPQIWALKPFSLFPCLLTALLILSEDKLYHNHETLLHIIHLRQSVLNEIRLVQVDQHQQYCLETAGQYLCKNLISQLIRDRGCQFEQSLGSLPFLCKTEIIAVLTSLWNPPFCMAVCIIYNKKGPSSCQKFRLTAGGILFQPGDLPWFISFNAVYSFSNVMGETNDLASLPERLALLTKNSALRMSKAFNSTLTLDNYPTQNSHWDVRIPVELIEIAPNTLNSVKVLNWISILDPGLEY